jgi:hypothetical protein
LRPPVIPSSPAAVNRTYKSAYSKAEVERLGFARNQAAAPALVIPLYNAKGEPAGIQFRPESPRMSREGKPVKYELPKGSKTVMTCHQ